MARRLIVLFITSIWNVLFFYLCGYWQQMHLNIDSFIDLFFGVLAVILLSLGEASVIRQIYYRTRFRTLKRKAFDRKFIRQCVLLLFYHMIVISFLLALVYVQSLFYIAILVVVFCGGWLQGSKTLWTGEEDSYYLNESGKLYHVESVVENDKVFELACTRTGERDRTITIPKKTAPKYE